MLFGFVVVVVIDVVVLDNVVLVDPWTCLLKFGQNYLSDRWNIIIDAVFIVGYWLVPVRVANLIMIVDQFNVINPIPAWAELGPA